MAAVQPGEALRQVAVARPGEALIRRTPAVVASHDGHSYFLPDLP